MLSIVVARYNEDLEWLNSVKEHVHLYNKGETLSSEGYASYKELPNVGREAHTYLQYIIDNYDNLPSVICFTQGQVADHYNYTEKSQGVEHLINLMNLAVLSEDGVSSNFKEGVINENCGPNFNIFRAEQLNDLYFKDPLFYNNGKVEAFKDWFERNLRIKYPEKLIHCWNAIFAVRSENIMRRSLNFYKNLLKEVDKINRPVEAHFFERAWYYVFQQPESDLDAIYFCQNHPYATYKTLEGFRKHHPDADIYLFSDCGHDYTEMAKHFNCKYTYLNESIYAHFHSYKLLNEQTMLRKLKAYWSTYVSVLEKSCAKYIIKLEDDVSIQGKVLTSRLNGFINGTTLHKLPDYFFTHYFRDQPTATVPKSVYFSGSGGCIFNSDELRLCLGNSGALDRVIESYKACGILGGVVVDDLTISALGAVLGYKIVNNPLQIEVDTEKHIKNKEKMIILHQVKDYYNMPLPSELAHLAKPT